MRAPVRPVAAAGASPWSAFLPLLPFMLPVFVGFFALGLALPVVPRYVHDTLGQGIAILNLRGGAIASSLAGANLGPARFDIDTIRKDLRTMVDEAQAMGARLPTAQAALVALDAAAADGLGNSDGTELAAWTLGRLPRP